MQLRQFIPKPGVPGLPVPRTALPQAMRAFFEMPFRARAAMVVAGCLPFTEALDLSEAIEIDLTSQATPEASIGAALTAAGSIVDPRRRIAVLRDDATVTGGFNIPAGVLLVSPNGAKIVRAGGSTACNIYDGAGIVGVELHNIKMNLNAVSNNGWRNADARIIGCKFLRTVDGTGPADGMIKQNGSPVVTWSRILWNEIDCSTGGGYGIMQQRSQFQHIAFNKVKGIAGAARGIFWEGGSADCVIEHNWIDGAIVGIGQLLERGSRNGSEGNILRWNYVANTTEEAISFDGYGNESTKSACYDRCVIDTPGYSGTPSSNPTITVLRPGGLTALPSPYTTERGKCIFLVVLQGPSTGKAFKVMSFALNTDTSKVDFVLRNNSITQAELNSLAGCNVSIQIGAYRNIIYNNYIHNSRGALVSWGVTLQCVWAANIMNAAGNEVYKGALSLSSLYGVTTTAPTTANTTFSISGAYDIVAGNAIVESLPTTYNLAQGAVYGSGPDPTQFCDPIPTYVDGQPVTLQPWAKTGVTYGTAAFGNSIATPTPFKDDFLHNWNDAGQPHGRHTSEILKRRQRFTATRTLASGATTVVIPHDMAAAPRYRRAVPLNALAAAQPFFVAASATDITITYNAAPGAGSAQWDIEIEV